jgi:hypothetical protein
MIFFGLESALLILSRLVLCLLCLLYTKNVELCCVCFGLLFVKKEGFIYDYEIKKAKSFLPKYKVLINQSKSF